MFSTLCIVIVLVQLLRFFSRIIYQHVYGPYIKNELKFKDMGKWAVVTGATDGLGKAYAENLAAKGLNIILISRSLEKLEKVAKEIETKFICQTKIIQADFTNTTDIYKQIEDNLQGFEIGVLVNNVGLSYSYPEYFMEMENIDKKINTDIINCNIFSVTNMTKIVLPGMLERKRGIIINISSTAGSIPSPMLAVYSATKAYVDKLSTDLYTEYGRRGIIIQSVQPGFVATNMTKIKKSSWMIPSPSEFVHHAIKTVGVQENTTGYYPHAIMKSVIHTMEYVCNVWARYHINDKLEQLRDKAIKYNTRKSADSTCTKKST